MPKSDPLRALESRLRADDPRSRGPTEAAARPPRDVEAWRRYGELLAAAGDPRAELVAIELRFLERSPREELELLRRRNVLQADLKRAHGLDEHVSGEWCWAFFVPSSVGGDLVGAVGRLAACSFVCAPDLELDFDGSTQPLGDALGSLVHLAPRTLRLKDVARPREALESLLAQGRPLLACLEGFALSCDEQPVFETEPLLLAALLEALPVVRGLTLWSCGLAEAGMVTLAEHASRPPRTRLEQLNLGFEEALGRGLEALLASGALDGLQRLALGACDVADAAARVLVESPVARRLRELSLWSCDVSTAALRHIGEGSSPWSLRALDLGETAFDDACGQELAERAALPHLEILDLMFVPLKTHILIALLTSPRLRSARLLADVADFDEESSARLRAFRPRLFISGSPDSLTLAVQRSDHWRA
ncbi:hypothetical protein WME75_27625 [Sorangium sp. So ce1014]|uniref:hypothetical protein n=1 Tax=Sorangium sp. So ce1014 TaxID=3133326 RepID=UPI003F636BCF